MADIKLNQHTAKLKEGLEEGVTLDVGMTEVYTEEKNSSNTIEVENTLNSIKLAKVEAYKKEKAEKEAARLAEIEAKAKMLIKLAMEMGKKARVHIAVDTGMNRIGLTPTESSADIVKEINALAGIEICGMFTHFARADEFDKSHAEEQIRAFMEFNRFIAERLISIPIVHCSNSAGIMDLKEANMDAVRAGITVYGLYPSDEVKKDQMKIQPAMELKSFITYIKEIKAGSAVSYGGTFVAERDMIIGTVGIGYADGYPRNASGRGQVLVCGKRVPILGRVCMDQLMIDLTEVSEAVEGSEVTLLGRDGELEISMDELVEFCDGFHYEIPCVIGKRVPRVYVKNGEVVGTQTCEAFEGF